MTLTVIITLLLYPFYQITIYLDLQYVHVSTGTWSDVINLMESSTTRLHRVRNEEVELFPKRLSRMVSIRRGIFCKTKSYY